MNRIDEWTQYISKCLKSETELLGLQAKHDLYEDAAKATFIRVVLEQFLPSSFAVGSGRVIDSAGNSSNVLDIVIYRRDFPQLNLPGSANVFLYESVLATIEVKTKVVRKTFFEALDNCASMAELDPAVNPEVLRKLASQNKMSLNQSNKYVHQMPLTTARFNLVGRPPSFVYAFSGYQTNPKQLRENIDLWIEHRRNKGLNYEMKSFPTVIATQGCFAWRNAAPFTMKSNVVLGLGNDSAPIRLIILQLMNALNRRLRGTSNSSGLNLNLDAYIREIDPPAFTSTCGIVTNPVTPTTARMPTVRKEVVEKSVVSAPAEKIKTPDAVEKEVVSAPDTNKTILDTPEVKTTPSFNATQANESEESHASGVGESSIPVAAKESPQKSLGDSKSGFVLDPVFGSMSNEDLNNIEPELANPEFIEPEIVEPDSDTEEELNTNPDAEPNPFLATLQMPAAKTEKTPDPDPEVESRPKPGLEDKYDPEDDPFLQTMKLPAKDLGRNSNNNSGLDSSSQAKIGQATVPESDPSPFSRTIPQ